MLQLNWIQARECTIMSDAVLLFSQQTLNNFGENILTFLSSASDCHIFEMVQINWDLSCTLVDINKIFTCQDLLKKRDFGKFQRLDDFLEYKKMWHKKTYKSEKTKQFFFFYMMSKNSSRAMY